MATLSNLIFFPNGLRNRKHPELNVNLFSVWKENYHIDDSFENNIKTLENNSVKKVNTQKNIPVCKKGIFKKLFQITPLSQCFNDEEEDFIESQVWTASTNAASQFFGIPSFVFSCLPIFYNFTHSNAQEINIPEGYSIQNGVLSGQVTPCSELTISSGIKCNQFTILKEGNVIFESSTVMNTNIPEYNSAMTLLAVGSESQKNETMKFKLADGSTDHHDSWVRFKESCDEAYNNCRSNNIIANKFFKMINNTNTDVNNTSTNPYLGNATCVDYGTIQKGGIKFGFEDCQTKSTFYHLSESGCTKMREPFSDNLSAFQQCTQNLVVEKEEAASKCCWIILGSCFGGLLLMGLYLCNKKEEQRKIEIENKENSNNSNNSNIAMNNNEKENETMKNNKKEQGVKQNESYAPSQSIKIKEKSELSILYQQKIHHLEKLKEIEIQIDNNLPNQPIHYDYINKSKKYTSLKDKKDNKIPIEEMPPPSYSQAAVCEEQLDKDFNAYIEEQRIALSKLTII